ncbi:Transcriptional regulator, HxlR family protein [Minicystis rosea]|nr:Transcriptional regulator, HxlR family protein [Minicystis rosea]
MKPSPDLSPFDLPHDVCRAVGEILDNVGGKWTILVVRTLSRGPLRFSELRRAVSAVTHKMLTSTLRDLERDGFVRRTVTPTVPPRVDYELTALGHDLMVPVNALATWALTNRTKVHAARRRYDARREDPPAAEMSPSSTRRASPRRP